MSAISTATTTVPSATLAHANPPGPALPDFASPPRRPRNPFPVGARFPRRTQLDILAYLAGVDLGRRAPVRRAFPVGARFPRRAR
jgi:hypothetical protein